MVYPVAPDTVFQASDTDDDVVPETERPPGVPGTVGSSSPPPPSGPNTDRSSTW